MRTSADARLGHWTESGNRSASAPHSQATRFGQREASHRHACQPPLAIRRKSKTGADVIASEVLKIVQDLILRHPVSQIVAHVVILVPHAMDARLTAHLARLDRDDLDVIHGLRASLTRYQDDHAKS